MVEYEALAAENLEEQADQEDEIGRIAGVNHVEAVAAPDPQGEQEFPEQCNRVFDEIGGGSSCFDRHGVAVDGYAVNDLMRLRIVWALRANHRYKMAGMRNVVASDQTRRSNGTGRFSTIISTRSFRPIGVPPKSRAALRAMVEAAL